MNWLSISLLVMSILLVSVAAGPAALGSNHGSQICGIDAESYDTETVYVNDVNGVPNGAYIEINGGEDTCAIDVDAPDHHTGDLTELEEAIIAVDYGGEVVVNEHSNFGRVDGNPIGMMHDGAVIGTQESENAILEDGKSFTLRGEEDGIAVIKSQTDEIAPLVFADNENEEVTIQNLVLAEGERALHVKSNSNVILEESAVDGSVESTENSDTHILFEDSLVEQDATGSTVQTRRNYYPDAESDNPENVREVLDTSVGISDINPSVDINNPSGFIFERLEANLDYNPVTAGSYYYSGSIIVDADDPSSDDEEIATPFESLDAALDAAAVQTSDDISEGRRGNVIKVRSASGAYGDATVDGIGLGVEHSLSIVGDSDIPEVRSIQFAYPGSYNIENLSITEGVETSTPNVQLDATNNYWGGPNTIEDIRDQRVESNPSSTVTVSPWCQDSQCNDTTLDTSSSNLCVVLTGYGPVSEGCQGSTEDVRITAEIDQSTQDDTDIRSGRITVEKDSSIGDQIVEVDMNIRQSSQDPDGTVRLQSGQLIESTQIQPDFNPVRDRTTIASDIQFQPSLIGDVTLERESDAEQVEFAVPLDTTVTLSERQRSVDSGVDIIDSGDGSTGEGVIQNNSVEGLVENQTTYVSRFNAGESPSSSFRDNTIPPVSITNSGFTGAASGNVTDFGNARIDNQRPATLRPQNGWETGYSIESLPPARNHTLNIRYAYQAAQIPQNDMDLAIVDSSGQKIYQGRSDTSETLEPTVSAGVDDPYEAGASSSVTETQEVSIPLHPLEEKYIRENGEIYITLENNDYDDTQGDLIFLLYEMSIDSSDNASQDNTQPPDNDGETVDGEPIPGDIDVEVNVQNANFNGQYDTYDVEPGDQVQYELVFENLGDTAVSGEFDVFDTHYLESGQFVNEAQFNPAQTPEETKLRDGIQINLGTGADATQTRSYQVQWDEADFGRHEVRVRRTDNEDIEGEGEVGFDTYVLQETTTEITDIEIPQQHVTYDSMNAEVTITNIGDLGGAVDLNAQFGNWEANEDIQLPGGDTRAGTTSENVTISFLRSDHPDSSTPLFNQREYTTPSEVVADDIFETTSVVFDDTETHGNEGNVYYRPNAPFTTSTGEQSFTVEVDSQIDLSQRTQQIDTSPALTDVSSNTTTVGELKISDFLVSTNPTAEGDTLTNNPTEQQATVYASAWPYVHPSMSQMILSRPYADHNFPTLSGEGVMFSEDLPPSAGGETVNRGSLPLNHPDVDLTSQPSDKYLSGYFSTRNRICNSNLLTDDGASMVNQTEADEGDAANSFVPFSANSCDDQNRITELQPMHFVGTTAGQNLKTDTRFSESSVLEADITQHPDNLSIQGVNAETFEDIGEGYSVMTVNLGLSNPVETEYTTTARVEIVTNRSISSGVVGMGGPSGQTVAVGSDRFDDNVVGAAAVRMNPGEEVDLQVPIVIRNNENVDGVHELSVRTRAMGENTEDYIEYGLGAAEDESALTQSPITGEEYDRFTIPIKVETFGDAVLKDFEPADSMDQNNVDPNEDPVSAQGADAYAYSVCRSNYDDSIDSRADAQNNFQADQGTYSDSTVEGLNPRSGTNTNNPIEVADGVATDVGQCEDGITAEDEKVTMEATYRNYGGEPIEIRPEMLAEFETRPWHALLHRKNAHATGDRFFADYKSDSASNLSIDTWSTRPGNITIEPGEAKTVTFERRFQEPGLYHLRVSPCRDITDSGPHQYNLEGFTGIPETVPAESSSTDPGHWTTARHGIDRQNYELNSPNDRRYNAHSTPEINNSVYNGALGCAEKVQSVFVYDSTKPVADFRRAHDETTIKNNTDDYNHAIPQSGDFGFDDEVETPEVNIVFAVDVSGSLQDESGLISDIERFADEQPDYYNYAVESYNNGGCITSRNLGNHDDFGQYINNNSPFDNRGGDCYGDSFEATHDQFRQYAGEGANNYMIALGDGAEHHFYCYEDSSGKNYHTEVRPDNIDLTPISVKFSGTSCAQTMKDLAGDSKDDESLYYDAQNDDFIAAFNQIARDVIGGGVFRVDEGGMLFIDGSTVSRSDCQNCYDRPHFKPYQLETPRLSPDFPGGQGSSISGVGEDFRYGLRSEGQGILHSNRMSVDNARIAGVGMPANLDGDTLQETNPLIDEKGMEWSIENGDPNYGQEGFCTDRNIDNWNIEDPDHHCYMEQFEGGFNEGTGNTPDYYEVVPHRFTESGDREVELTVWDDPTLTRGEPHSNTTSIDVTVDPDNDDPTASITHTDYNDLSYDKQSSADPVWHRMEGVYEQNLNYRGSAPSNFGDNNKYADVYEGTRTCFEAAGSDAQIGVSQDRWSQTQGGLDAGTRFIDQGSYKEDGTGGYNALDSYSGVGAQHVLGVDMTSTRAGNRRCAVFSQEYSEGSDGNRTQIFQYEVWDYAENRASATTEEIDVKQDGTDPTIDTANIDYSSSVDDNGNASNFIWAYNPSTSSVNGDQSYYRGGDLKFDLIGSDNPDGIGTACLDLRLQRGSGLNDEVSGQDIHDNCATMGDEGGPSPEYEGIYGNAALFDGTGYYGMGTNSDVNGYDNREGWFSAYELSYDSYQYQGSTNAGGYLTTTETEKAYLFDWHGNMDQTDLDVRVIHDQTSPDIETGSQSCGESSCSDHSISISSDGYTGDGAGEGGTPIVDAEVVSTTWTETERTEPADDCSGSISSNSPNFEVNSLPEGQHSGTVTINNDASVSASTSCSTPPCDGGCNGPSTAEIEYDWGFELKITDAHGNTETETYSGTISAYESDGAACASPCPPPGGSGGGL